MGKLSDFDVNNHVPSDWSCPSTSLISIMSVEINKSPRQRRQVNSFIKKASAMIRKQVSAFGKSEEFDVFFSMQLNKNWFSIQRYGFPQNQCHLTCLRNPMAIIYLLSVSSIYTAELNFCSRLFS